MLKILTNLKDCFQQGRELIGRLRCLYYNASFLLRLNLFCHLYHFINIFCCTKSCLFCFIQLLYIVIGQTVIKNSIIIHKKTHFQFIIMLKRGVRYMEHAKLDPIVLLGRHSATEKSSYWELLQEFSIQYKMNTPANPEQDVVHFHNCFEVVLYVQSNNKIYIQERSYELNTHDLILIPPRTIHTIQYDPTSAYTRYVFYFTDVAVLSALHQEDALQKLRSVQNYKLELTLDEFSRLITLFKILTLHYSKQMSSSPTLSKAYCQVILCEIYEIFRKRPLECKGTPRTTLIENILHYINVHYQEQVTLEKMEKFFFVSKFYLSRLFSEEMNTSIIEYLQFKRITEAQRLLQDTDLSILEICFECGFNNLQHFYRTFKKISLVTPKQFRQQHKNILT